GLGKGFLAFLGVGALSAAALDGGLEGGVGDAQASLDLLDTLAGGGDLLSGGVAALGLEAGGALGLGCVGLAGDLAAAVGGGGADAHAVGLGGGGGEGFGFFESALGERRFGLGVGEGIEARLGFGE